MAEQPRTAPTWPAEQPVLTDGLVTLRALEHGDIGAVFRVCQDEVIQHFTRVPVPYLEQHARGFVAQGSARWRTREGVSFAVTGAGTDEFLGTCGLVEVDLAHGEGAAGYWVAPSARGRGVARAALTLLTAWCLDDLGLHRLTLEIEQANPASAAVAVAAGYEQVGEPVTEEMKGTARQFLTYERRSDR